MEEYRSNSNKSREQKESAAPDKKIEKVVNGEVKLKKKRGLGKFSNLFGPEDVENAKDYILYDVIVPAVKDIILDTVRTVLGVDGRSSSTRYSSPASKIRYQGYYDDRNGRRDPGVTRSRSVYDYDDVIFKNRGEAEVVLRSMDEIISVYKIVSVADFYDLAGITTGTSWTDNKYGWSDIRNASVQRIRDGYVIRLPRPMPID